MKKFVISIALPSSNLLFTQKSDYAVQGISFNQVNLTDNFWLHCLKVNHTVTVPTSFERCESTGHFRYILVAVRKSGNGEMMVWFPEKETIRILHLSPISKLSRLKTG